MSYLRPDLQQRNQYRCEDRTKKDAHDAEHLRREQTRHHEIAANADRLSDDEGYRIPSECLE